MVFHQDLQLSCFKFSLVLCQVLIRDKYMIKLRNTSDAIQEISENFTLNHEYENFVNAHMVSVAGCIPTKLKVKNRVP